MPPTPTERMTVYRYRGKHRHTDALVIPHRQGCNETWVCGVLCSQVDATDRPGDITYRHPNELTKATAQDFRELRLRYSQGYNN